MVHNLDIFLEIIWRHIRCILWNVTRWVCNSFSSNSLTNSASVWKLWLWAQFLLVKNQVIQKKLLITNRLVFCFHISLAKLASCNNWKTLVLCKISSLKGSLFFTAFCCRKDDKWLEIVLFGWSSTLFTKDFGPEILWANDEQILQYQPFLLLL